MIWILEDAFKKFLERIHRSDTTVEKILLFFFIKLPQNSNCLIVYHIRSATMDSHKKLDGLPVTSLYSGYDDINLYLIQRYLSSVE